ncbi:MAG: hypothetical protein K0U66_00415 [Gammaproteobacteria bacterium]|nr:hypothetical protein [Gammaproteobacteria bacterium]
MPFEAYKQNPRPRYRSARRPTKSLIGSELLAGLSLARIINAELLGHIGRPERTDADCTPTKTIPGAKAESSAALYSESAMPLNRGGRHYQSSRLRSRKLFGRRLRAHDKMRAADLSAKTAVDERPVSGVWREDGKLHIYCRHPAAAQRVRLGAARWLAIGRCQEISVHVRPDRPSAGTGAVATAAPPPPQGLQHELLGLASRLKHDSLRQAVSRLAYLCER